MTIAHYVRLLRLHWLLVVVCVLLGAGAAGAYSWLTVPVYRAEAQLFVSTSSQNSSVSDLSQGGTFAQKRVKSYADLLTSRRVLTPVIQQLQLATTPDALARHVVVRNPLDTVLLNISVQDTSAQRASDIANAIAKRFPDLVEQLETPTSGTGSPIKVSVAEEAVPPAAPVSPRTSLNLLLGLLIGAGLGVLGALARESLDRTVGSRTQAAEIAGAPVLGAVAEDASVANTPLITHDAFAPRAEAFRQLRTNLRFLSVDDPVTSFVVTGSVQGEGKSTTAANIAISLAQSGESVVLIDADLRRPTIADLFGLAGGVGLTSVLVGQVGLDGALQAWRDDLPLQILAAGPVPPNPSELIGSARMADVVSTLVTAGYTVVVDSPPLLPVTDATILARITAGALVVTRVASTRVEQLGSAIESLRTANAPVLGVVLNRIPKRGRAGAEFGGYAALAYSSYAPHPAVPPPAVPAGGSAVPVAGGWHDGDPRLPAAPSTHVAGTLLPPAASHPAYPGAAPEFPALTPAPAAAAMPGGAARTASLSMPRDHPGSPGGAGPVNGAAVVPVGGHPPVPPLPEPQQRNGHPYPAAPAPAATPAAGPPPLEPIEDDPFPDPAQLRPRARRAQ